jgi:hypothetical protein
VWIEPPARDRQLNPSYSYVVSFIRFLESGFAVPASRFMRALCYHYGVELHNFTLNMISQAATSVGVCEGFLGIPVNWDLWVHLFRAELHTLATPEPKTRRVVRAGGMTIALWNTRSTSATTAPASPLLRQGVDGEVRLLAPWGVPVFAPGAAGFAPSRVEGPGG